jgi:putative transcriptional regulator
MRKQDIEKVVKAVETDMGHECPDLAGSLAEMIAKKAKVKHTVEQIQIIAFRKKLKLTQGEFSKKINTPLGTLRDWEQGNSQPNGAALLLTKIFEENPQLLH